MRIPRIGLVGVSYNGILYWPSGGRICKLPLWIAGRVQKIQHRVAKLTWGKEH